MDKLVDGQRLLFVFAWVMIAAGTSMLRARKTAGDEDVRLDPAIAVRLVFIGLVVGGVSGFFGIGGGS